VANSTTSRVDSFNFDFDITLIGVQAHKLSGFFSKRLTVTALQHMAPSPAGVGRTQDTAQAHRTRFAIRPNSACFRNSWTSNARQVEHDFAVLLRNVNFHTASTEHMLDDRRDDAITLPIHRHNG
jgi:hypothetical protein